MTSEQNKAHSEAQKQWFLQNLYQWIKRGQWHCCFNCTFVQKTTSHNLTAMLCLKYNADPPGDVMFLGCDAWQFEQEQLF